MSDRPNTQTPAIKAMAATYLQWEQIHNNEPMGPAVRQAYQQMETIMRRVERRGMVGPFIAQLMIQRPTEGVVKV